MGFFRAAALLALALSFASAARAENVARWRASMYGESADDSLSSARVVGVDGRVEFARDFGESVHVHFLGGVFLETGSSSSLFTDEFQPLSRIYLKDARLTWDVASIFSLEAGALQQLPQRSPLLLADSTFPAALAHFHGNSGALVGDLGAEAAIPIGQRLSTKSAGKEPTPLFYAQTASGGWKKNESTFAIARATHFQFSQLTHGMAQDSRFYGNTVSGVAGASTFYYGYEGFELGGDASIPVAGGFNLIGGVSHVQNRQGPPGQNTGIYGYAGGLLQGHAVDIRAQVDWYQNDSDSTPAFYTSSEFGHNNRRGPGAGIRLALKKIGLDLDLRARTTNLINAQPFQKDKFQYYELKIGIPYANF